MGRLTDSDVLDDDVMLPSDLETLPFASAQISAIAKELE